MFRSKEQKLFAELVSKHMTVQDAPLLLEGGTGLGKTRAYLAAVAQTDKRVAIVLPTHTLIDQLLASSDLKATGVAVTAFRPARMFENRAEYQAQRQVAMDSRVMVCTSASVIIDQRLGGEYNGVTEREYIVFDEADQLPQMAALQSDFTIDAGLLGQDLRASLVKLSADKTVEPEIKAAARIMIEILDEPVGYARVGRDDSGNGVLCHYLPARLLKRISNRASVAFVSATLSHADTFDHFKQAMGITAQSVLSTMIEPVKHGEVKFEYHPFDVESDEWFDAIVFAAQTSDKPVLIATTSHNLTDRLTAVLGAQEDIIIKAGAWAGLDLPAPPKTVIVPRAPYPNPTEIDGEQVTRYFDGKVLAMRRLKQVLGRGLRTPDAVMTFVVLDKRIAKLTGFTPKRFKWFVEEGERREVKLSKAERSPQVRQAALKHYGAKCMYAGCATTELHRLDVHHLDPVSEGTRRTTLEDVMVVCKHHHADLHFKMSLAK